MVAISSNRTNTRQPKLSIVIPCLNGGATLSDQLESFANQTWSEPWELIVADNGSTDNTLEILNTFRERIPNLRVVDASLRRGQPYALNVGSESALGESLAFCDADDVVGEGYVAAIGEALKKYDFVACRLEVRKLNPGWLIGSRKFPQDTAVQKYWYPPYLHHAGGGTIGVKHRLFTSVGGFDESLPYLHDTDFCWKLQLAGVALQFVPEAVIHTRLRHTLSGIFRQARAWGAYNVIIYKKYLPLGMPKLSPRSGLKAWGTILSVLPQYPRMDMTRRVEFLWQLAWRIGRLEASLKHRVFAL